MTDGHQHTPHGTFRGQADFDQRPIAAPVVMEDTFANNGFPTLIVFRRHLGALLAVFQTLQPEDRTSAVAMTREALGRMQAVVKYQLCNDALKTVAALAENMIQEAYGFSPTSGDLALAPSPIIASSSTDLVITDAREFNQSTGPLSSVSDPDLTILNETVAGCDLSVDNADVLTNALYATLQAVNPCELSPSYSGIDQSAAGIPPITSTCSSFQPANPAGGSSHGASVVQSMLTSFFGSTTPNSGMDTEQRIGTRLFKCGQCGYVASHRQNLHRHEQLHKLRHMPAEQRRRFTCDFCDRRFITRWAVKEHTKYKHPDATSSSPPQGTDVETANGTISSSAVETIPNPESSNSVEIAMNNTFACEYCGKSFPLRNAMKRHMDNVHLKIRDYKCSQCQKAFGDNYHLQRHVKTVHMALRTHECQICGKLFSSAYHMHRHVKNLHP